MGTINSLAANLLQSSLLQTSGVPNNTQIRSSSSSLSASSSDVNQFSPLGQALSQLQRLRHSDPAVYQDITRQIATNLQAAAQADTAKGDAAGAKQLNQLAADFTQASSSGQLPNIQDLAQSSSGGPHHHHGHSAPPSDSEADTSNQSLPIILQTLSKSPV